MVIASQNLINRWDWKMPNNEPPFRLYPGSNEAERKINAQQQAKPNDLLTQVFWTLMLTLGVAAYFGQQRQNALIENEHLKQTIIEQQQKIDAAPNAAQIAEEVKRALEQKKEPPVEAEKKEPQKPVQVKRSKPKRISQGGEVYAHPSLPAPADFTHRIGVSN